MLPTFAKVLSVIAIVEGIAQLDQPVNLRVGLVYPDDPRWLRLVERLRRAGMTRIDISI